MRRADLEEMAEETIKIKAFRYEERENIKLLKLYPVGGFKKV